MAASTPHPNCFDHSIEETSNIILNSYNGASSMVPFLNYDINSPVSVASFPDLSFGLHSDAMLVPQMSGVETRVPDFSVYDYNQNQVFEPGEECSGFLVPSFWSPYNYSPMPAEDWIIQGKMVMKGEESDDQVKVGRYSVEERKDRILRYLKKRKQRNFNKTIKYACRKTLADKRVRVRGRFAKYNEPCQEEILNDTDDHDSCNASFQMMKYEEDYWLEAAIDNLGQLPYLAS